MDIGKTKIEIECPKCKNKMKIILKQVANEEIVSCLCGHKIQLRDIDGKAKKSIRDLNQSFNDIKNTLDNFGR